VVLKYKDTSHRGSGVARGSADVTKVWGDAEHTTLHLNPSSGRMARSKPRIGPQIVVLAFLFVGLVLSWIATFFGILITGRYPRVLFDYNVGVMRWGWRVSFYSLGAFATDQYPPFTLQDKTDYPAHLDVAYPEDLNRWLVLVKWFLVIPHLIVVGILVGGAQPLRHSSSPWSAGTMGLTTILALVAVVVLAFNGNYPRHVFDLLMGLHRWVYRVEAYIMLMTDEYPPFRLDSGGNDPATAPNSPLVPQDRG
jgi:hypothetical protein